MRTRIIQLLCGLALTSASVAVSQAETVKSSGTGFAVTPDGWILTNAHVVESCDRVEVKGLGRAADPRIDPINDLALVRVNSPEPLKPLVFRRGAVRLGEDIVAIGYPLADLLADSVKITTGNVNALAGLRNDTRYIQTSTPIQPGNSGGPVVDRDGLLLGVTSATFSKTAADELGIAAQKINFAIRASVADLFMQSQSISNEAGERTPDAPQAQTADLAEKITPSVFQILCYGKPEVDVAAAPAEVQTSLPGSSRSTTAMIQARGYDAIGFDYRMTKDVTLGECQHLCEAEGQCKAVTYNMKHKACFLKDNIVALIRNTDAIAAYSSWKASDVIVSDFTSYSGVDVPGGDYKRLRNSNYLACFTSCIGEDQCLAFAYVSKKSECWLKNSLNEPRAAKGVELGIK